MSAASQQRLAAAARADDGPDWGQFIALAVAGAAANSGSTAAALARRPGSWEADRVRALLESTVGNHDEDLLHHRTEPIRVVANIEQLLEDTGRLDGYWHAVHELDQQDEAATSPTTTSAYGARTSSRRSGHASTSCSTPNSPATATPSALPYSTPQRACTCPCPPR